MLTKERLLKFDLEEELYSDNNLNEKYKLLNILYEIRGTHNFITSLPSFPKMTDLIYSEEQINAIGGTQSIEGIILTPEEIQNAFNKDEKGITLKESERTSVNLKQTYDYVIKYVEMNIGELISESVIKQIHKYITQDLNELSNTPGEYRKFQVQFGIPRRYALLQTESEVVDSMKKFVEWLNAPLKEPFSNFPIIKANLAHYYLVEIHPFGDGNGRTARALEALILYKNGKFNNYCFWSLSNHYAINRNAYLDHFSEIIRSVNVIPFLKFAADGYLNELKRIKNRALSKVKELMFMDYVHYLHRVKRTKKIKINQRIVSLLQFLCDTKGIQFSKFSENDIIKGIYSGVSQSTIKRDVDKIGDLRLIKIVNKGLINNKYIEPNFGILDELEYK